MSRFGVIVVGGGLRGLVAGLRLRDERPDTNVLVVEARSFPGGSVRTQRSNGFACELGAFAFTAEELEAVLPLLPRAPAVIPCSHAARTGWLFDGSKRQPTAVEPPPLSFATGCEELIQALRRALGDGLRLGRAVTSIAPAEAGFLVELGGEVPAILPATEVVLAIPSPAAGRVLEAFDPTLAEVATRTEQTEHAFAWFGCIADEARELTGYGMLAEEGLDSPISELIFCSEVFPNRAMPGHSLVRAELAAADLPADDGELLLVAEAELRRWTGTRARFGFTKVHRFKSTVADGVSAECRTLLTELQARVPGLTLAT